MTDTSFQGTLSIIGGTGALGSGLARRAARAGIRVVLGSRDANKAAEAAARLQADCPGAKVSGYGNVAAAREGDMVAVTVPFASQLETLEEIRSAVRGKVVIDATVPLVPPKVARVQLPPEDSAAVRAQRHLGDETDIVSALHNIAAVQLAGEGEAACDVLVFGDRKESRDKVLALMAGLGLKSWHGGPLANSAAAEALTSVLIFINKTYGPGHAGIKITFSDAHA